MAIGHVMLDIDDLVLSQLEKEIIDHPQVGGVILFARNYENKKQLRSLTKEIHKIKPECLIAVDQEGGRVQRFRKDFTPLPTFKEYGDLYQQRPKEALKQATIMAHSMAQELLMLGVNISFTPVLDLDRGISHVIADRSFNHSPEVVIALGQAFIKGMHEAGMPATGKHFPGHGFVAADSHLSLPVDSREYEEIYSQDMKPFIHLKNDLDGIMPAHILYECIDAQPTCFSKIWLQDILRSNLQYEGVIFSDDLSMEGANKVGDYIQRSRISLEAGCDMILICNARDSAIKVLDDIENYHNLESQKRLIKFRLSSKAL